MVNMLSSFLVAAGLSMDNLAVTISAGCSHCVRGRVRIIWQISFLFALAHFVMFAVGFEGGVLLHAGKAVAPWIACLILFIIGARMIKSALCYQSNTQSTVFNSLRTQFMLAIATSVDALFVGTGMALTSAVLWQTVLALVICVFATSLGGFYLGHYFGLKFGRNMEIVGGSVLVFWGVKVLLEGLGIW